MAKKPAAPALTEAHRAWIVTKYATYARTYEILREFEEEFGFAIPGNRCRNYDLSGVETEDEAKAKGVLKWMPLFRETRERFNASVTAIPIASATYRVKKLDQMFDAAFAKRNYKTAAQLLEQAAKETGGMFTNKRELTGAVTHTHEEVPSEVKRSVLAQRVREAVVEALATAGGQAATTTDPASTTH